jgi:DNA-binding ferritin-like protein (Dps family)
LQIVREGAKRATQQRGFQQLASYFTGVQAMQEPTGEQQRNQIMREQKAAAYSPYTGSGSKAQVNAVRNANPAYQVSQAQYGALPGESNDISYIYDTQKRQQVNDAYDALKDVLLQVQPWDKKLMSALEDSRATALSMVRDSDAAGQASDWTQEYKRFTATGEGASATTTIPYRPLSIAGATPDEALNIRKNEIMRYVSRTQPSAEDYMNDDGEIDFDAYNAAKKEWAKRLPSIALGLREVAQIGMQADKEGMGDELADYVMNLSQADVDTYRQRNDTPAEAAQRAYFDLVYNKTWDKYNQLVQAGTSKSDAYSRTVGAVGPLGTNELAQLVQRKYGDRWSAEELAQGIGNMTMPAMEQVRLGNLDTAGKAKVAAQQDFWDTYNNQIPPGKASYEIKQNPLVAIALDADTRGYATTQIYQAATALMRGWVVDNYGAADPEWAAARSAKKQLDMQITARYGRDGLNLLSQYEGLTDAAGKAMLRAQHPTLNNILMLRAQFATQNQLYRKYYGTGIGKR